MNIQTLIELCKAYSNLGWAVQEQLIAVAGGEPLSDQNGNALRMILDFLWDAEHAEVEGADDLVSRIERHLAGE